MAIGMDGGPENINRERLRIHEHFQGPFGFGSPDDAEGWDRVQIGAGAVRPLQRLVRQAVNRLYVLSGGQLRHHAAVELVQLHL